MNIKFNTNCHEDKYYIRIWLQNDGVFLANVSEGKKYLEYVGKESFYLSSIHLYDKNIDNLKTRVQSIINALENCDYEIKYMQDMIDEVK